MSAISKTVISIRDLSFSFSDRTVLDQFFLDIAPGEFHYLLGQNATGKSTLVRLLSGHLSFQKGEIQLDDTIYKANTMLPSHKHQVYAIQQIIGTFDNLSIFDNIYIPCMDLPLHKRQIKQAAQELIEELDLSLELREPLSYLSMGDKRIVELITAYVMNPKVLILDEPGAYFSNHEMQQMCRILEKIKMRGTAVLFCTYHVCALFALADRVTIIRGGNNYLTISRDKINPENISSYLYEDDLNAKRFPRIFHRRRNSLPLLSASHLTTRNGTLNDISLTINQGEIVGVTGISGAGKSQLSQALIGNVPLQSGSVYFHPSNNFILSASQASKEGIGYISGDPSQKLMPNFTTAKNITISNLEAVTSVSLIHQSKEERIGDYYARNFNIKSYSNTKKSCYYSLGEQQKINISRLLFSNAHVIIADEPTNSVDVPSKTDLYNLFNAYAANGNGILLFSSDFLEICGMCDRVYVLRNGEVAAQFTQPGITVSSIASCAYS